MQTLNFFHPSTALILDDHRSFLEILRLGLTGRVLTQIVTNPIQAIKEIEKNRHPISQRANLSFKTIGDLINNPKRFEFISVVVVDYNMPEMNGIEFCRAIHGTGIKRIMLTGEADHKIAVKAFNEGILEHFILKGDPNLYTSLELTIAKLQHDYFASVFGQRLWKDQEGNLIKAKVPLALFSEACGKTSPSEHYLVDQHGSFLLLDHNGDQTWVIIRTEEEIAGFHQTAVTSLISDEITEKLAKRTHVPILLTEDEARKPASEWQQFLHSIKPVPGSPGSYCAIIRGNLFDFRKQNTFVSHQDFLTWWYGNNQKIAS